jgi:hypothetical protein
LDVWKWQRYSMDYIKGGTKLLLCQVLMGKVYHCTQLVSQMHVQPHEFDRFRSPARI